MKMIEVTSLTGTATEVDRSWRPMSQKSVLDKTHKNFLRTLQLGEHGLVVIRGKNVCYFPMEALLALAESSCPALVPPNATTVTQPE